MPEKNREYLMRPGSMSRMEQPHQTVARLNEL